MRSCWPSISIVPALGRRDTEERLADFCAACADRSGHAQDLAFVQDIEGDVFKSASDASEFFTPQHHFARFNVLLWEIESVTVRPTIMRMDSSCVTPSSRSGCPGVERHRAVPLAQ